MKFVKIVFRKFDYKGYTGKFYIDEVPPRPMIRFYNFVVRKDKQKLCHKILVETLSQKQLEKTTKEFIKDYEQRHNNKHSYMVGNSSVGYWHMDSYDNSK